MLKKSNREEVPLPEGWESCFTSEGKQFFIDHNSQQTTWLDPRDELNKPSTFAECYDNELPYGWQEVSDSKHGKYFTNHQTKHNQLEDPRMQWQFHQAKMLKEYLDNARQDVENREYHYLVKNERFQLAKSQMHSLESNLKSSVNSLNSSTSVSSTRHDPDILRQEITSAKLRISKLRKELAELKSQVDKSHTGIELLDNIGREVSADYRLNDTEANKMIEDIDHLSGCLSTAEAEKKRLRQSLSKLKREILHSHRLSGGEPVIYQTSAAQTDVSGEAQQQLAELVRLRLMYDDSKTKLVKMQNELISIENQIPDDNLITNSSKFDLIKEKEKLLMEYNSQNNAESMERARILENELWNEKLECNNRLALCEKSLLLESKKNQLIQNLENIVKLQVDLRMKINHLYSASMTSMSSESSIGSLSANSSRGSLTSLGPADIYYQSKFNPMHRNVLDNTTECSGLLSTSSNSTPLGYFTDLAKKKKVPTATLR